MANQIVNGITFFYPDSPCFVFNPAPIRLAGNVDRLQLTISGNGVTHTVTYNVRNNTAVDISEFLQGLFFGLSMGADIDYSEMISYTEMTLASTISAVALDAAGNTLAICSMNITLIWGALAVGEDITAQRKVTYFRGYPFTIGFYARHAGNIIFEDGLDTNDFGMVQRGLLYMGIDGIESDKASVLLSFEEDGDMAMIPIVTIDAVDACDEDTIYLRWVNRHGMWDYWLFKVGDPTRTVAGGGTWNRNNVGRWVEKYHWQGDAGRRQNLTRNDVIPVCAPLVDSETFDMLQDVTTSPCVDMYVGTEDGEPKWTAVTIEAGQYTKDNKKPEQDFVMNIVLPEIPIQSL